MPGDKLHIKVASQVLPKGAVADVADEALLTSSALATGIGGKRLYQAAKVDPKKFLVTYHLNPHLGFGHKNMAEQIQKGLSSRGYETDIHGWHYKGKPGKPPNLSDWSVDLKGLRKNRHQYAGHLDVNPEYFRRIYRQTLRDVPELKTPSNWRTDFNPNSGRDAVMPFATEKVRRFRPASLQKLLRQEGIDVAGKKVVTLSAGGSGVGMDWRLRHTLDALAGRPDTHLVVAAGNNSESVRKMVGGARNVSVLGEMPRERFNRLLSNSHLNIGYPGSSSLSDALAFSNPNILAFGDKGSLAAQNAEWAGKHYGMRGFALGDEAGREAYRKAVQEALDTPGSRARGARQYVNVTQKANQQMLDMAESALRNSKRLMRNRLLRTGGTLLGVGGGLAALGLHKRMQEKQASKSNDAVEAAALGGYAAASAAAPSAYKAIQKARQIKINPATGKIVILTEGGPFHVGGAGHSAAARAIAEEAVRRYGPDRVSVVNHNDLQMLRSEAYTKKMRELAATGTDKAQPMSKRLWAKLRFGLGNLPMRPQSDRLSREAFEGASRIIATNPDSVNYARKYGIRPELVVTDYDIRTPGSRAFWNLAYGTGLHDPHSIGRVYMPGSLSKEVFQGKTPITDVGAIPVDRQFYEAPQKKLKEITLRDNKGNVVGTRAIPKGKRLITVTGGSTGGDVDKIVDSLLKSKRTDFHVVGIAGKNPKVLERLRQLEAAGMPVTAQGFEKQYRDLLYRSDAVFSRPHGLSVSEALATGRPVVPVVSERLKGGKLTDTWAPHMTGNAKHYSKLQKGAPIAALFENGERSHGALVSSLDDVLTNSKKYQRGAREFSGLSRAAAGKILDAPSATTSVVRQLPKSLRNLSYGAAGLAGAGAIYKLHKALKPETKTASVSRDTLEDVAMGSGVAGITAAALKPYTRLNPGLTGDLESFSNLLKRHRKPTEFIHRYVNEASDLLNRPIINAPGVRRMTIPNMEWVEVFMPDKRFINNTMRRHNREISKGPIDAYIHLTHEGRHETPARMRQLFADKAKAMKMAVPGGDFARLTRADQNKLLATRVGSELDELMKSRGGLDMKLFRQMKRVPSQYAKKLVRYSNLANSANKWRGRAMWGGLGLAGASAIGSRFARDGEVKKASAKPTSYAYDFAGGVDPTGWMTPGSGLRNEKARLSEADHRRRQVLAGLGGLIGGAILVPGLAAGVARMPVFAWGARGKGGRTLLREALRGFESGALQPTQSFIDSARIFRALSKAKKKGVLNLSKGQVRSMSRLPNNVTFAGTTSRDLAEIGPMLNNAVLSRTLSREAAESLAPHMQKALLPKVMPYVGTGLLSGVAAVGQYEKGRDMAKQAERKRHITPEGAAYRKYYKRVASQGQDPHALLWLNPSVSYSAGFKGLNKADSALQERIDRRGRHDPKILPVMAELGQRQKGRGEKQVYPDHASMASARQRIYDKGHKSYTPHSFGMELGSIAGIAGLGILAGKQIAKTDPDSEVLSFFDTIKKRRGLKGLKVGLGPGDFYSPSLNTISLSTPNKRTLAHEMGHAANRKSMSRMLGRYNDPIRTALYADLENFGLRGFGGFGRIPVGGLALATPFLIPGITRRLAGRDESSVRHRMMRKIEERPDVVLGAAVAPKLLEEGAASVRGLKYLAEVAPSGQKLKAVTGGLKLMGPAFGTYAAAAALPVGLGILMRRHRKGRREAESQMAEYVDNYSK